HRRLVGHLRRRDTEAIRTEIHQGFADARDRLIDQLESIGFFDEQSRTEAAPA
ncbi:MAG TPA: GntR family transcriptional regulator, partial [Gordonia sp. (in: high G+C Gram-positive bacteria)]|nr:GntR family transcriptional regulator [Gordonia sp. (in: high G+C Gram-positive bacteria)]